VLSSPDLLSVAFADRLALAEVTSVKDPDGLGRVEVRLWGLQGVAGQTLKAWARVAVPFAGPGRGAFLLPEVGDEVLVGFVDGDPRHPVVIGSIWNGAQRPPEQLGGDGRRIDRWSLTTRAGTRIAIVAEAGGSPKVSLTTPGGVTVELHDGDGGKLTCRAQSSTITLDGAGVTVRTGATVSVDAGQVEVTAGSVSVKTGTATFSGVVQCNTLVATTVNASVYSPGVGNIW
jgi:uncharacterized protein involved in type VI secretion and phage assembly